MRVWFIGGGSFAAECLRHMVPLLSGTSHTLEKIITGLPTRSGRGLRETPSKVEAMALELGLNLALERTGKLSENTNLITRLESDPPDAIFVIDFAQLIKSPFLTAPKWGCLNIHPSLLPRWRGAAPIPRAILNGDPETGVTVFQLVRTMDAGPILEQARLPITQTTTASQLYESLSELGAKIAVAGLDKLALASITPLEQPFTPQDDSLATHAEKLERCEFEISWNLSAQEIDRRIRGLDASGGAFVLWNLHETTKPVRLKLWRVTPVTFDKTSGTPGTILSVTPEGPVVACRVGMLRLDEVQAEGKRRTSGADWARGVKVTCSHRLCFA